MSRAYSVREGSTGSLPFMGALAKALEAVPLKTSEDRHKDGFYKSEKNYRLYIENGQTREQSLYLRKAYDALEKVKSEDDIKSLFDPNSDFHELNSLARAYAQRIVYDAIKETGKGGFIKVDLNSLREKHINDKVEYYYEMDSEGNVVTAIQGFSTGVVLPAYGNRFISEGLPSKDSKTSSRNIGGFSWHNHPGESMPSGFGFPPSISDIDALFKTGIPKGIVEAEEGRYILDATGVEDGFDAVQKFNSTWNAWRAKYAEHALTDTKMPYKDWFTTKPKAAALIEQIVDSLSDSLKSSGVKLTFEPSPSYKESLSKWKSKG